MDADRSRGRRLTFVIGVDASAAALEGLGRFAGQLTRQCVEETVGARVAGQQGPDFVTQRLVSAAGVNEVLGAAVRRQRPDVREYVLYPRPVVRA